MQKTIRHHLLASLLAASAIIGLSPTAQAATSNVSTVLDLNIDFVGATATMNLARTVARTMADVTIVGIGGGEVPLGFFSQPYEVSMATTYWGSRPELVELLALAARGQVGTESTIYPLDQGVQAYRDLRAGTVTGRAVVVP